MPDDLETLAYRIVQEALSNAGEARHGLDVTVHVETDEHASCGSRSTTTAWASTAAQAREYLRQGRVGLASMRERVELASGTFAVRSTPGRGTTITATLPLDPSLATRQRVP